MRIPGALESPVQADQTLLLAKLLRSVTDLSTVELPSLSKLPREVDYRLDRMLVYDLVDDCREVLTVLAAF